MKDTKIEKRFRSHWLNGVWKLI